MQLWWRSEALLSLRAYICGIINKNLIKHPHTELQKISIMILPLLEILMSQNSYRDVSDPGAWIPSTAALLEINLLNIYYLLPIASFTNEHSILVKKCSELLKTPIQYLSSSSNIK